MVAYSTASPVLPRIVLGIEHGNGAAASGAIGLFATAFSLMQFVFGPVQGGLSDRFGRRAVLVLSGAGLALSQTVMALAPSIALLLAGRILAGIAAANISTASAYLADVTEPDRRAVVFGRVGIAIGAGIVAGPAIGGALGAVSARAPFWAAAGLCAANALWAFLAVPESLPPDRRTPFRWRRANPVGAMLYLFRERSLRLLAASSLIGVLAQQSLPTVFVLSAELRFHWPAPLLGLGLATLGLFYAVVGGALVRPALRRFGEGGAALIGLASGSAGFALFAGAPNGLVYLAGVPLLALWGLAGPAIQGAMTRAAPPDGQGRLQGANTSLSGLGGIVGPSLFAGTLAGALDHGVFAGLPFALAAALLLASLPPALAGIRRSALPS